ncbi:hypothetical protein [Salinisphaera hydrothermalis]|uniref:hypothetical protein n=1 Tax=Salinisphaera hydrothermalis TaxID=563188 RepID=UPI00333F6E16
MALRIEITNPEVKRQQRGDRTFYSQEAHAFIEGEKYPKTVDLQIPADRNGMGFPPGEYELTYGVEINSYNRPTPAMKLDPVSSREAAKPKAVNS